MTNTDAGNFRGPLGAMDDPLQNYAMSTVLARNWWAVGLRGIFAIIFGLIALFMPGVTMLSLVIVFAAYMLVDGIFAIISAIRAARQNERWGLLVLEGIVDIVTGIVAFLWPGITVLAFVLLFAAWAIVSGVLRFAAAFRLNIEHGRIWLAIGGLASFVFGILLILAPLAGAIVLTWWLGAFALIFGCFLLILAFRLRAHRNDTALGGLAGQPA